MFLSRASSCSRTRQAISRMYSSEASLFGEPPPLVGLSFASMIRFRPTSSFSACKDSRISAGPAKNDESPKPSTLSNKVAPIIITLTEQYDSKHQLGSPTTSKKHSLRAFDKNWASFFVFHWPNMMRKKSPLPLGEG